MDWSPKKVNFSGTSAAPLMCTGYWLEERHHLLDFLESLNFCALIILLFVVSEDTVKVRVSPIAFNPTKFVPGSFEETAQNWSTSFSSDSKIEPKWRPTALAAKEIRNAPVQEDTTKIVIRYF